MKLRNVVYFWREAWKSLRRNKVLTIASVSTVSICILILGMAVLMTVNAGNVIKKLESDVEMVAFLDRALTRSQLSQIEEQISKLDGVKSIKFVSRDTALARLEKSYGNKEYDLKSTLGKNPLPHSFEVKAKNPHDVPRIASKVEKIEGIYKVNYGQGVVERLFAVTKWVRVISLAFIVLLSLGAVFLIATTIRLAIYARRKEIYLMKLVGATDWFIRWPFFIEGILLGTLGALLSILLLAGAYSSLVSNVESIYFIPLVTGGPILNQLYIALLAAGAVLGVVGTYISLNRFLDV